MKLGARPLLAAALLGALLLPPPARGAAFPPGLHFKTVETSRVVVSFHEGLEGYARRAAAMATEILEAHEARYGRKLKSRLQLVISDVQDDPNGFTTPFPYPLVSIRASCPDGSESFGNYESWMRLLLTHELAHSVHLEEGHSKVGAARKVFGRAPFLFPNLLTPTWMIEGLATFEETRGTAFGRGRSSDVQMVIRMAALEGRFPGEDQAVAPFDRWPLGDTAYFFGEGFLEYLSERFGDDTLPRLAEVHSGRLFPYLDELTAARVTGLPFFALWKDWAALEAVSATRVAEAVRARGVTESEPLTTRGIRQSGPRFSPDGTLVAYTSSTLTRFPKIRLVRRDGSSDRALVDRNGGTGLSWTPDGKGIVYDEPDVVRFFAVHYDLKLVDVATGKVRALTHGARARFPDVSHDGKSVVYVRLRAEGSELAVLDLATLESRDVTKSADGTMWGSPHFSPSGERIAASRYLPGGLLDIVTVDPGTGDVQELTHDRARDVEPVFTPDGARIVFRSDRDGISNLYAVPAEGGDLVRLTNVIGGAFDPDVSPEGAAIAFSRYSSLGYDVEVMPLGEGLGPPPPFVDAFPAPREEPPPVDSPVRPYRPLPLLLPRYWTPYAVSATGEWRFGVVTGGQDPLGQNAYALEVLRGTSTGREDVVGVYQYDRFYPTLVVAGQDVSDPEAGGAILHSREVDATVVFPVTRSLRLGQSLSLAYKRRRETLEDVTRPATLDLGGVEIDYDLGSAKLYPLSISPVDGWLVHAGYLKEEPSLGGTASLGKLIFDGRGYLRVGDDQVVAVRGGLGATFGSPRFVQSFAVGGFPEGSLADVIDTNFTVLRGYPDDAFQGRSFVHMNAEYRFPLLFPEHGYRSSPVFLRHLHGAVFADAANAWVGPFRAADLRTALGAAVGFDAALSQAYPLSVTLGVARGFSIYGETRFYARLGLSF
jgi:hypothetical protein